MGIEALNDDKIEELITVFKRVVKPKVNWSDKTSHRQKNYDVMDTDGRETFTVYVRQNLRITDDFSVGLLWHSPDGEKLTLVRYNGPSHPHRNHLENATLEFACHIHRATRRYIDAGKKADGYAMPTTAYSTVEGALDALIRDCNIYGLSTQPDQLRLL